MDEEWEPGASAFSVTPPPPTSCCETLLCAVGRHPGVALGLTDRLELSGNSSQFEPLAVLNSTFLPAGSTILPECTHTRTHTHGHHTPAPH